MARHEKRGTTGTHVRGTRWPRAQSRHGVDDPRQAVPCRGSHTTGCEAAVEMAAEADESSDSQVAVVGSLGRIVFVDDIELDATCSENHTVPNERLAKLLESGFEIGRRFGLGSFMLGQKGSAFFTFRRLNTKMPYPR